jgi:Co/Zn/Cd efflux system component
MTAPVLEKPDTTSRSRGISFGGILVLGVFVVPFILTAVLNSYGPLTEESALRMAFATVAGQTIAILTACAVLVLAVKRRQPLPDVLVLIVIGAVITAFAIGAMGSAGNELLARLDLIAEVAALND